MTGTKSVGRRETCRVKTGETIEPHRILQLAGTITDELPDVKHTAGGTVYQFGVSDNLQITAGEVLGVITEGRVLIEVGTTPIVVGNLVKGTSSGKATPCNITTEYIIGIALQSGILGELVEVMITKGNRGGA